MNYNIYGIDVSKAFFDVYDGSDMRHYSNDEEGFKALAKGIDKAALRIVMESTGR